MAIHKPVPLALAAILSALSGAGAQSVARYTVSFPDLAAHTAVVTAPA